MPERSTAVQFCIGWLGSFAICGVNSCEHAAYHTETFLKVGFEACLNEGMIVHNVMADAENLYFEPSAVLVHNGKVAQNQNMVVKNYTGIK